MVEFEAEIIEIIQRTDNVKSFRLKRPDDAEYRPGQFLFITINVDGEEKTKPLSFSSSPTEKYHIEFSKCITDSDFSRTLNQMQPGENIKVRMPYGSFIFEGADKKIALLSGGIGITPFRSICKYAVDKKNDSDIFLIYGSNTEDSIVFREDFDIMQDENPHFHVVHTLADPEAPKKGWHGTCGFIDSHMLEREIPDFAERIFLVCGPPVMVGCMVEMLKKQMNIPEEQIRIENFTGY